MSTLDIVDELAALLEPDPTLRDDSGARPVTFAANTLYAWPRVDRMAEEGDGTLDQITFAVRVAWAADAEVEISQEERDRATTQAIQDKADSFKATLRAHRTGTTYQDVHADQIDWESLITNSVRGFYLDLSGFVIQS